MLDFIFVVLVYRNTDDLIDFFKSLSVKNSKVVVVNSFYDLDSEIKFKEIAQNNNADFITVENKGYGYGNNMGIDFVNQKYSYKYLIISNADIIISKLSIDMLSNDICSESIIAPKIKNLKNKNQNPYLPYYDKVSYKLLNMSYSKNWKYLRLAVFAWRRICRESFLLLNSLFQSNSISKVFAAHGSFIILSKFSLEMLDGKRLFSKDMFLFLEEDYIAMKCRTKKINILYHPKIEIFHKEDGSINLTNQNNYNIMKDSFRVVYNKWFK